MAKKKIDYGSLFTLRKDGRYTASYTDETGRHFLYDRDPERLLNRLQSAQIGETVRIVTFRDIAEAWETKHWEEIGWSTAQAYTPTLRRLLDLYGDKKAEEITAQMVQALLSELGKNGYSRRTVQMHRDVLNMIYNSAIVSGVVKSNPVVAVSTPRNLPTKKRNMPDDDTITAIRTKTDHPFALFALICVYAGLRRGEVLAIRYEDIDRKKKLIHVTKAVEFISDAPFIKPPKTESGVRDVILLDVLASHIPTKKHGLIFARDNGNPLTKTQYRRRWASYCKYIGHNITAHQLRHAFATTLFEAGIPDKDAQELLGHANITTTKNIYTHIRQTRKDKTADRLNAYFDNNSDNILTTILDDC